MKLEFKPDRDKDFLAVCDRIRNENKPYISVADIAAKAIHVEAESYYLTTKQIITIIQTMRFNRNFKIRRKANLYGDIFTRYLDIKKKHPNYSVSKIAKMIDAEKAPRFYLTANSAKKLLYNLIKNRPRHAIPNCNHIHSNVSSK